MSPQHFRQAVVDFMQSPLQNLEQLLLQQHSLPELTESLDKHGDSARVRSSGHRFLPFRRIVVFAWLTEGYKFWVGEIVDVGLEEGDG